jgi:dTDP-4-amino-4,6-dideoxygalactose transaminase
VIRIPLVDLRAQHEELAAEIQAGFARVIDRTSFILGPEVAAFEEEFALACGVRHCIGVASGTDALELVMRGLGIGRGDEVILPANSFIASALAVVRCGATPILVDCDPKHLLIDPERVAERLGPKTRAIMPVHLFGQIAPMSRLRAAIGARDVAIIEDAAQAQCARQDGVLAGHFGVAAGTSFHPAKNLGAYGDAGAVLTDSEPLARRIAALRNYGSEIKYHHPETGFNSRLDSLQAAVLRAKLPRLQEWNDARRRAAGRYRELLTGIPGIQLPQTLPGNEHVWHLYVIRTRDRDAILKALHDAGIGAGVHYPVPIHLQGALRHLGHAEGAFPHAERAAREMISLPMYPSLSAEQQHYVADTLRTAVLSR